MAHSIFRRWRPLFRSDGLFTEVNHVLSKFSTPFLTLFEVDLPCETYNQSCCADPSCRIRIDSLKRIKAMRRLSSSFFLLST